MREWENKSFCLFLNPKSKMFDNPEFIANPYPTYSELRSHSPIHWVDILGGAWLLPRYDDVVNALRDPRLSAQQSDLFFADFPPEMQGEFAEFNRIFGMWLLSLDGVEHNRVRKLMNKGFKMALQNLRPRIQKVTDLLLDRVQATGEFDLMRDFALPFPMLVMAEMLGVDAQDRDDFISWSEDILIIADAPQVTLELARQAQKSLIALNEYFRTIIAERRQNPGEDLISFLIHAEEDSVLTTDEVIAQSSQLIAAGYASIRNFLGNGIYLLLKHIDQLKILRNNPSLMPNALRELLRYESSAQFATRFAREDFFLYDRLIKKGQTVIALIGSANRDPEKFPNPDVLDITRNADHHLAFGYGAHACLGATLTYIQAEIAFLTVIQRMPNLRLVNDTPEWNPGLLFRGFNSLPLTF